ncbi:MAG: CPBP family glutamic-type intramembrane protease [Coriobacteriia bacterium]
MARTPVRIKLDPNRCDRCRRCVAVCEANALKIGPAYIYLDWRACTECMKCVDACEKGCITRLERSRHDAPVKSASAKKSKNSVGFRRLIPRTHVPATPAGMPPYAPAPAPEPAKMPSPTHAAPSVSRPVRAAAPVPRARELTAGPVTWSLMEGVAIIAVAFAALFAKDAILGARAIATLPDEGRILARVAVLGGFYAVQFVMIGYLAHRRGATLPGALGLSRVRARFGSWLAAIGWVALLLVTTRVAAWVWGIASRAVGFDPPTVPQGGFAQVFGAGWAGLALSIALVVIIAPLAEEMVFRGIILGALGARWGALTGLLGSALIFALYHLTPWQIVPIFILGIACGWLTQHRGSLWPAVWLHVLYNAVPVVLAFIGNAA